MNALNRARAPLRTQAIFQGTEDAWEPMMVTVRRKGGPWSTRSYRPTPRVSHSPVDDGEPGSDGHPPWGTSFTNDP
jgi:hypothetical protein